MWLLREPVIALPPLTQLWVKDRAGQGKETGSRENKLQDPYNLMEDRRCLLQFLYMLRVRSMHVVRWCQSYRSNKPLLEPISSVLVQRRPIPIPLTHD